MDTAYLEALQQTPRLERLLESLVERARLMPEGSFRLRNPRLLPEPLQDLVTQCARRREGWGCWSDGAQLRLFLVTLVLQRSRESRSAVIEVRAYDEGAALRDRATWSVAPDGGWIRCVEEAAAEPQAQPGTVPDRSAGSAATSG